MRKKHIVMTFSNLQMNMSTLIFRSNSGRVCLKGGRCYVGVQIACKEHFIFIFDLGFMVIRSSWSDLAD